MFGDEQKIKPISYSDSSPLVRRIASRMRNDCVSLPEVRNFDALQ